jgi:glycosyltransferase involved in cell wall biosynthesis
MRIVQIVNSLDIGGLERLAIDLAATQKQQGHSTTIYCLSHSGTMAPQAIEAGIPIKVFEKKTGVSPYTLLRVTSELRADRPEVVHTHNAVVHHYGVAAARLAGVPVVVNTRHGLGTLHSDPKQDKIFRASLPFTDKVVMVSDSTREFFAREKGVPYAKSSVILNGIPLDKFGFCKKHSRQDNRYPKFGTVGRLVPAKDHITLLKAFKIVTEQMPTAHLTLVGDGVLRTQLESLVLALGLQKNLILAGATPDPASYLQSFDIFVLSSVTEGLPVAVLEAMAAGLPIVSTRVAGVPQVAPEGSVALYCPPSDAAALAKAMLTAANSPDLGTKGANARAHVERNFSITKMWTEYQSLIQQLLSTRNPTRARACAPAEASL